MEEQKKRSIAKTLTWRITASLITFVIVWIIAGDWKIGGIIAGIEIITKMFLTAMAASIKDFSRKQWDPFLNYWNRTLGTELS